MSSLASNHRSVFLPLVALWLASCGAELLAQTPGGGPPPRVYRTRVEPHWLEDRTTFWYRNDLPGEASEILLVDAAAGTRSPAFDHGQLAFGLSRALGREVRPQRLPIREITFEPERRAIRFELDGGLWRCDLKSYECRREGDAPPRSEGDDGGGRGRGRRRGGGRPRPAGRDPALSPDGKWRVAVKENNLFLRSTADPPVETQLSQDGREGLAYGRASWSPDSRTVVAFRIEPGEKKEVHLIRSSPEGGGRATLSSRPYALPGDRFTSYEWNLFDVETRTQIKPAVDRFEHEWLAPELRWLSDGRRVALEQVDRGHQRLRVLAIDRQTGEGSVVLEERSSTFIWTAHTENLGLDNVTWLTGSDEVVHASEKSGWRHLYLVDARLPARPEVQLTSGEWVVRGIDQIDEEKRQIWFRASGLRPGQDPYFVHAARVNLDGTGLVILTEGDGDHEVQYSPDRSYLIDTYSRVDRAPITELRRTSDGSLVLRLEEADTTELLASGWQPPEIFVAKARDGKTDIWGIICRPRELPADQKCPVIEDIYAGPQSSYVPKSFSPSRRYESLTRLGFVVVKVDGMGTANRSKAFHDVCWKNLKDAGFEDRILWMKAAAASRPYMDLSRVGVFGTSAGGQNAAGALLFHPEFYRVAVANCGCHDNRMDKASWNEQWLGYPVGPQYSESSNIDNAARLQGKLLLIVGEVDDNVPPESTYRLVDALIRAGKDFDFLPVPGGGHGAGGAYGQRRLQDFFVRHLLGREPPNRNLEPPPGSPATQRVRL